MAHAEVKADLKALSQALKELHRELLMLEARALEESTGKKLSPYDLLHASLHHPALAWLRAMSQLIVSVDTIVEETEKLTVKEGGRVAETVLTLIEKPMGPDQDFWTHYSAYLSSNPDVIMRHSQVKSRLAKFLKVAKKSRQLQ